VPIGTIFRPMHATVDLVGGNGDFFASHTVTGCINDKCHLHLSCCSNKWGLHLCSERKLWEVKSTMNNYLWDVTPINRIIGYEVHSCVQSPHCGIFSLKEQINVCGLVWTKSKRAQITFNVKLLDRAIRRRRDVGGCGPTHSSSLELVTLDQQPLPTSNDPRSPNTISHTDVCTSNHDCGRAVHNWDVGGKPNSQLIQEWIHGMQNEMIRCQHDFQIHWANNLCIQDHLQIHLHRVSGTKAKHTKVTHRVIMKLRARNGCSCIHACIPRNSSVSLGERHPDLHPPSFGSRLRNHTDPSHCPRMGSG